MALLTDQTLASGVTLTDLIHIVITGDTSQNPAGSSFKATVQQVADAIGSSSFSGGTVPFATDFTNGLSANTFSATTYFNLPSFTGEYLPLSGGTVTGNTYFGATSGITIDQVNNRLGINTATPQYTIEAFGSKSNVTYQDTSGGVFQISGDTFLPRFQVSAAPTITKPTFSFNLGVRTYDDITFPGFGKEGDAFIYASNEANGLNIINRQTSGSTLEDYIRFYAGQDADGTTPDIHIQGTGTTRGYVGIGTITPTEKLDVNGNAIIQNNFTASTVSISSTPTTDQTNTNVLVRDSSTGLVKQKTIPNTLSYGVFSQTGDTPNISGTSEQSIIDGGVGGLSVGANQFQVGDAFLATFMGHLSNSNDNIVLRVKSGSVVLADSGTFNLNTGGADEIFTLQINFVIRQIGGTGTASIFTKGMITTIKTSNYTVQGFSFEDLNNTTFDTTISNTLDVTIEFDATDPTTYIYTDYFTLTKLY